MPGLRSSLRANTRKSYTDDAFAGIEDLVFDDPSSSDEASGSRPADQRALGDRLSGSNDAVGRAAQSDDDGDDDEFMPNIVQKDGDAVAGEDNDDDDTSEGDPEEDIDQIMTNNDEPTAYMQELKQSAIPAVDRPYANKKRAKKPRIAREHVQDDTTDEQRLFVRGYPNGLARGPAKEIRRLYYFGPRPEDYRQPLYAWKRWLFDPCLPSKQKNAKGFGGFDLSAAWEAEASAASVKAAWKWFHEDGGEARFDEKQLLREVSRSQASEYLHNDEARMKSFVAGPLSSQRLFQLQVGESLPISATFSNSGIQPSPEYKSGFYINLGTRVHCLEWVPSQRGPQQYLAVATLPARPEDDARGAQAPGRAFVSQYPYKSAIQIWEFAANDAGYIRTDCPSRLQLTLCIEHGDIKIMKWCPAPSTFLDQLGLLACVTGDGALRVYNVPAPASDGPPSFLAVTQAAFEVRAPKTVYTCVTWLSSTRLGAGCANGCFAIWDLPAVLSHPTINFTRPRPVSYFPLSTSYILNCTSAYPSHPHFLMASSMNGHITTLDLRATPQPAATSGTSHSGRSRLGQTHIAWTDHLKSLLSLDDGGYFRAYPLRMSFVYCGVGKSDSQATSLAVSPAHPCMLVGTAKGDVIATNPAPKIVGGGKHDKWQQVWFAHEWRRDSGGASLTSTSAAAPSAASASAGIRQDVSGGAAGLARFTEGYKPQKIAITGVNSGDVNVKDGVLFATVYEEASAVTALAWNPNLHVAGWAAAGCADGLVRVEVVAG